jgi:dTDP-4-amino-4,6-dideoxygalactose transaminase
MGLTLLEDLDKLVEGNYLNYQQYQHEIQKIPGISLVNYDTSERNNYQYIIIEVDESITQISRDQLMSILSFENIYARRYFHPGCHRMEPYCSRDIQVSLPYTDLVAKRVLALPTGEAVSIEIVMKICHIIRTIIYQRIKIKEILEQSTTIQVKEPSHKLELRQIHSPL